MNQFLSDVLAVLVIEATRRLSPKALHRTDLLVDALYQGYEIVYDRELKAYRA